MDTLDKREFRRRIVANAFPRFPSIASAFETLRFVQADPIRAPARAQDLILRHRLPDYGAGDLEKRYPELSLEEGYLFAYGFMISEVWDYLRRGRRSRLKKKQKEVLDWVREQGEVHPRTLSEVIGKHSVKNAWGGTSQEGKRILEHLHEQGYLRVSRREKGVRLYAEAPELVPCIESPETAFGRILLVTLQVFGPVQKRFLFSEVAAHRHLVPNVRKRNQALKQLLADGAVQEVRVDGVDYLWIKGDRSDGGSDETVRILAPFDPLVRDRERFEALWEWRYRFEAYVPAARRKLGYYAMPLLWRDKIVGWVNAAVKAEILCLEVGYALETPREATFRSGLEQEAEGLATFLGLSCGAWKVSEV